MCRRTLLVALAIAAAKVRSGPTSYGGGNAQLGALAVKAVTAHGFYVTLSSLPLREPELRKVGMAPRPPPLPPS